MEKALRLQLAREDAALKMVLAAQKSGVPGVAMVETMPIDLGGAPKFWTTTGISTGTVYDPPENTKDWAPNGVVYDGTAYGKIAQVRRTGQGASVSEDPAITPLGEAPWQGCLVLWRIRTNLVVRISYSGGSEEQDVTIARIGYDAMLQALDKFS